MCAISDLLLKLQATPEAKRLKELEAIEEAVPSSPEKAEDADVEPAELVKTSEEQKKDVAESTGSAGPSLPLSKTVGQEQWSLRWRREKGKPACLNLRRGKHQVLQLPGWASLQPLALPWCLDIYNRIGSDLDENELAPMKVAFLKELGFLLCAT